MVHVIQLPTKSVGMWYASASAVVLRAPDFFVFFGPLFCS